MPYPNGPGMTASSAVAGGPQPPLQATSFVQNEHGMLIPVYGNEALDQYAHGPRGPPTESTNSVPGSPTPMSWPGMMPPYPPYPAWLPQQLTMPHMAPVPPAPGMMPPFSGMPNPGGDWDNPSPLPIAPQQQQQQQPAPFAAPMPPQFHPLAQNPYVQQSGFPGFSGPNTPVSASPMPSHFRPRLHSGKRQPSHGGGGGGDLPGSSSSHGPTLQQLIGLNASKKQNSEQRQGQHQQHPAAAGPHANANAQSQPRQTSASGSNSSLNLAQQQQQQQHRPPLPAGAAPAMFPYPGFPFPYDPSMPPPPHAFMMPGQHPLHPQQHPQAPKGMMPAPMQWSMVPAAYDNP